MYSSSRRFCIFTILLTTTTIYKDNKDTQQCVCLSPLVDKEYEIQVKM